MQRIRSGKLAKLPILWRLDRRTHGQDRSWVEPQALEKLLPVMPNARMDFRHTQIAQNQ